MNSLLYNNTWIIIDLPPNSKAIRCKWIFRRKYNSDGSIQTFKARLVAKEFIQKKKINYFDTYTLVALITFINTFRFLINL